MEANPSLSRSEGVRKDRRLMAGSYQEKLFKSPIITRNQRIWVTNAYFSHSSPITSVYIAPFSSSFPLRRKPGSISHNGNASPALQKKNKNYLIHKDERQQILNHICTSILSIAYGWVTCIPSFNHYSLPQHIFPFRYPRFTQFQKDSLLPMKQK